MAINYNLPITREDINIETYNAKFIRVHNWLDSSDKNSGEALDEYGSMLLDPTTFMYLHFRIDGKPLQLFPYQDLIATDPYRFKYFRAANQIGKSLFLDAKAARNLLIDHGHAHNEAIVSKSLPQSMFQMRRVKALLNSMPEINWKDVKGETDSMSIISVDIKDEKGQIKYTNYLICAPSTEGLLGYDLHELNLDEFEFWDVDLKYFFNQIAQPRTYATKGNITIFSNPNGSDNFGSELEAQVLPNGQKKWHVYVFNYLDRPGNTQEDLDMAKTGLSRAEIESTLLAIRTISDRNYFTSEEISGSYDPKLREVDMLTKQTFWFLDVGAKHDQCVLVGGYIEPDDHNPLLHHIYVPVIKAYPIGYPISMVVGSPSENTSGWTTQKSVKEYLQEYNQEGIQPVFGCDVTGNSGIVPLFESVGINAVDVTFSGPVKSGMYQRLKYFMEKGLLHRTKSAEFDYQFSHLQVKKSVRGYLMIHHENEKDLDDVCDAFAAMVHLADGPVVRPTLTII
jgi:hypothetical protein